MITFGSLFSGIGGIDLGLERAGMRCAWQVEIDDYATRVLEKHWSDVLRFRDVRQVGAHNLPAVDLLAGGFPCQPHSTAGKRKGASDERDLWPEFRRIIRELRPRWVLAENVSGLLSNDDGRFFGSILRDLATCGYDAVWDCIPAAALGAPHRRDRVFIVAYPSIERNGRLSIQQWRQNKADFNVNGRDQDVSNPTSARSSDGYACALQGRAEPERAPLKLERCDWWATEPDVGRMADGVPHRVDRLRGLGNAVVPQVAEFIGRCILESLQ